MQRFFLKLGFDGSAYHGWQIQPNAHTVQAELEKALSTLLGDSISVVGCGRTDTGVHAKKFYAHFELKEAQLPDNFVFKLNRLLSDDVVVYDCFKVDAQTHARFSAHLRSYAYYMTYEKALFDRQFVLKVRGALNTGLMNQACEHLIGVHDFSSFCKSKTNNHHFECDLYEARVIEGEGGLVFEVSANRFLRGMVRALVGTLIEVGKQKITPQEFKSILESKDRTRAAANVKPHALFLTDIQYENISA